MSIGVFVPGASALHRLPPGLKLAGLAVYAVAVSLTDNAYVMAALLAVLGAAWAISGIGMARLLAALKPLVWILAALFVFQLAVSGVRPAMDMLLTVGAVVVAAALVSHTTRTDDMLAALKTAFGVFAPLGVNAQSCAFAVVFTIRLVPFVATVGREAIAARMARGASGNPLPAVVPVIIRLMRETDQLAEGLVARGFGRA
ncbi:MAG: energy-coupling factor transporter transmembrane protein EcfT [Rhodospirillaceae bacterium]|nr:energy-coupling factor transporter transmembrane protein EcfT [Rhodospirillaceae bacterium]